MQNKSKSHTDVQWVISSMSLAAMLGLWGLIASADKQGAGVSGQATFVQPTAEPQQVVVTQQTQTLLPGQVLLFGGTAPQPAQTVVTTVGGGTSGNGGNTGHRGGGGGSKPAASTGSSKPRP